MPSDDRDDDDDDDELSISVWYRRSMQYTAEAKDGTRGSDAASVAR